MLKILASILLLLLFFACSESQIKDESIVTSRNEYVFDSNRNRQIPIQIYSLSDSTQWNGELVLLSAGYGSSNTEYTYITQELAKNGYYVISIQHEIQTDEMLPSGDDIIQLRTPNWNEGIKSIEQVLNYVKETNPIISTKKIHLIGHSNGGDISVLFAARNPKKTLSLITLDHRRMPIPRTKEFKTLSFRADQFEADKDVFPPKKAQKENGITVIDLKNVDHNYLRDIATEETKKKVISAIFEFLDIEKK